MVSLDVDLVPERVRWNFQDTFNQAIVDPVVALTPDNQQSINYFTTGPQIDLNVGSSTRLTLRADYSVVNSSSDASQADDLDSERYAGDMTLTHDISNASNLYLLVEAQEIDFKDETALDYDSDLAYLGLSSRRLAYCTACRDRIHRDRRG